MFYGIREDAGGGNLEFCVKEVNIIGKINFKRIREIILLRCSKEKLECLHTVHIVHRGLVQLLHVG